MRDNEIKKVANQSSVKRGIRQWFPRQGSQMPIEFNWSDNNLNNIYKSAFIQQASMCAKQDK